MKLFFLVMALAVASTSSMAGEWRNAGESLYGSPSGNANSHELQNRGRLDEALRNGTAGFVGNSTTNVTSTSVLAAGCIVTATTSLDDIPGSPDTDSKTTCKNNGDVSGSINYK